MKKIRLFVVLLFVAAFAGFATAQDYTNYISCKVDGKEYKAEARRMRIPVSGFEYHAFASFQVSPDVQVWIRFYFRSGQLKPGTYEIIDENDFDSKAIRKAEENYVWAFVDYTEETKGLGHAYHDGESFKGTITVENITPTSIDGTFEATLRGVYYKKRAVATMTGSGIRGNLEKKMYEKAGGGMLVNAGAHDHDNTKKTDQTDTIVLSEGKFFIDWSKPEKEKPEKAGKDKSEKVE